MTITGIILDAVKKESQRKILHSTQRSETLSEIYLASSKISSKLIKDGIKQNDRIAILSNNTHSYIALYMGCIGIGAIPCPINIRQKPQDITAILSDLKPSMVFANTKLMLDMGFTDIEDYESLAQLEQPYAAFGAGIKDENIVAIQYTSGTQGAPKGVQLSHRAVEFSARSIIEGLKLRNDEKVLILNPFAFSLTIALPIAIILGSETFIMNESIPDPAKILSFTEENDCSFILGALPFAIMLLQRPDLHKKLPFLKRFHCFGSAVPEKAARAFEQIFGAELSCAYALSESGYVGALNSSINGSRDYTSIGIPFPGVKIDIQDEEIIIDSPSIMSGYFGDTQQTEKALADGKLHTGDLGKTNENGQITFLGRKDEMYKTNGLKVFPIEIENALTMNADVLMAAVIGVPDEQRQNAGKAYVILKDRTISAPNLAEYLKQYISDYKVPKYFEFVEQLPLNSNGKVDKKCLKA